MINRTAVRILIPSAVAYGMLIPPFGWAGRTFVFWSIFTISLVVIIAAGQQRGH